MARVEFERTNEHWNGLCTDEFDSRIGLDGRTDPKQCKLCVTPVAALSNSCRVLWTPDDSEVYWSSLPDWTGNASLIYPTTQVFGNWVFTGADPFAYTINNGNLTFDHDDEAGPMFFNDVLENFTAENPGPLAWIMEDNPCEERNVRPFSQTIPFELGTTDHAIPAPLNDVHAQNATQRVAFGPTVALTINEAITYNSSLAWLGDSNGAASNHSVGISATIESQVAERWSVVARSVGGGFGQPIVLTFGIEATTFPPNNGYQLDCSVAWLDSPQLPSFYTNSTGDRSLPVTGNSPQTAFVGPFSVVGGVHRRTSSGITLNEGTLSADHPGNIVWSRNAPN